MCLPFEGLQPGESHLSILMQPADCGHYNCKRKQFGEFGRSWANFTLRFTPGLKQPCGYSCSGISPPITWSTFQGSSSLRETGGAPRNPAPRNHLLVWIVKPSGCHRKDALGGKKSRRVPTALGSTSIFLWRSETPRSLTRVLSMPSRRWDRLEIACSGIGVSGWVIVVNSSSE